MKSHTAYLTFNTKKKRELVHLTPTVAEIVGKSGIDEGFVLVSAMPSARHRRAGGPGPRRAAGATGHITAGVFVNDDESGLHEDIWKWLEHLASEGPDYEHHRTGEDNGHAHLKSLLVHHEVTLPITKGKLDLGPWQRVFYAEFDGQRPKRLIVKALGFSAP